MNKKMTVLCDVDGTVADHSHRVPLVMSRPRRFVEFNALMHADTPIAPVISVINALHVAEHVVLFVSGREGTERHRGMTRVWLSENVGAWTEDCRLFMRPASDYRADDIIKEEILDDWIIPQYGMPDLAFDDRTRVVEMWRRRGIRVAQMAEGNF